MVKKYKCIIEYPDCKKDTVVIYHPGTFPEYFDEKSGKRYKASDVEGYPQFWEEVIDYNALLEEAKMRYPVGTKYISPTNGKEYIVKNPNYSWAKDASGTENAGIEQSSLTDWLYYKGKWAEIVEPLFYTEDGKAIYENDKIHWVLNDVEDGILKYLYTLEFYREDLELSLGTLYKLFSTRQAAQDWIDANKPKSKEYEILKIISNKNNTCWGEGKIIDFKLTQEGNWNKYWNIYSIKRLSDGEIFSLGDKINHTGDKRDYGVITEFDLEFLKNNSYYHMYVRYKGPNYHTDNTDNYEFGNSLDVLEHAKEPKKYTLDEVFEQFKEFMNDKA